MARIKKIMHVLLHERNKIYLLLLPAVQRIIPDKPYVKLYYYLRMGEKLDLNNPKSFNEKLNWLKLYDRNPLYTTLVDKYEVKDWVKAKIGEEYMIPTLGVWESFDQIPFDELPNQFVLKTTHGGGSVGVVICKDKNLFDKEAAANKINRSMQISGYDKHREWPYKNVHRRIIAEKYMEDAASASSEGLIDYKFYCFNGVPTYCQVIRGRGEKLTIDFYDMEWNHMPFVGLKPNVVNGEVPAPQPTQLEVMISICRKLSADIPFSRIDLYEINGCVYFGEVTFFPAGSVGTFRPAEWNYKLGELINLEGVKNKKVKS